MMPMMPSWGPLLGIREGIKISRRALTRAPLLQVSDFGSEELESSDDSSFGDGEGEEKEEEGEEEEEKDMALDYP